MADAKISQLPVATSSAGTDVLPIVQSSTTKQLAIQNLVPQNLKSNATTGVLQVTGPAAGTTRVMTAPNANFTVARTDAAQSFTGDQTFTNAAIVGSVYTYSLADYVCTKDVWYVLGPISNDQIWRLMITDTANMGIWHRADDLYISRSGVATFKNIYDVNPGYAIREWRVSGGNIEFRTTVTGGDTANTVTAMRVV